MRGRCLCGGLAAALSLHASAAAVPTPPPTPVPPYGSPSPFPTALRTPDPSTRPPRLSAPSAALVDLDSGEILFDRRGGRRRPVASTTKIMTALVVLESAAPSDEVVVGAGAASQEGAELGLEPGERIAVDRLLYALMLQSSNDAAAGLAEHVAGGVGAFVSRMNRRARALGLSDTRFASATGLDDSGYSTARDLSAITVAAFRSETFAEVVRTRLRTIPAPRGPARRVQNRNALLWLYPGAIGVKTGYTAAAGFCLVAAAERDGLRLAAVVLGAPREAFSDAAALLGHGFATYERRTVVENGEELEPARVGGRVVALRSGGALELLLRRDQGNALEVRLERGLRLPVREGQVVGEAVALVAGAEVASAPVVAAAGVVALPPPPAVPWWRRVWEAVRRLVGRLLEPAPGAAGL